MPRTLLDQPVNSIIVYSDYEPLPRLLADLEEVHKQIETGASMTEHSELRQRLGVL